MHSGLITPGFTTVTASLLALASNIEKGGDNPVATLNTMWHQQCISLEASRILSSKSRTASSVMRMSPIPESYYSCANPIWVHTHTHTHTHTHNSLTTPEIQILEKQIERDLDPDSGMTAAEVWEDTAATTINIVNESLQVSGPDFVNVSCLSGPPSTNQTRDSSFWRPRGGAYLTKGIWSNPWNLAMLRGKLITAYANFIPHRSISFLKLCIKTNKPKVSNPLEFFRLVDETANS
jgi:hypothetical protein